MSADTLPAVDGMLDSTTAPNFYMSMMTQSLDGNMNGPNGLDMDSVFQLSSHRFGQVSGDGSTSGPADENESWPGALDMGEFIFEGGFDGQEGESLSEQSMVATSESMSGSSNASSVL